MQNKQLIITLIQQDLKHHQLITGLENIGLNAGEKHHLELLNLCHELIQVPTTLELDWGKTYSNYMNKALRYRIDATSEGLRPLAESCYIHLQGMIDLEHERVGGKA